MIRRSFEKGHALNDFRGDRMTARAEARQNPAPQDMLPCQVLDMFGMEL